MGNILRGVLYTGLAVTTGIAGYMLGKYKHIKGVSLTMVGLALVLYAPRGCDVLETQIKIHGEVEKARIYGTARKDSIDNIINSEKSRDSTLYLKQFLETALSTNTNLEKAYKGMIETTEREYQNLLKKNDAQYISTLNKMSKQNEVLKKNIEELKTIQAANYDGSLNSKINSEVSNYNAEKVGTQVETTPETNLLRDLDAYNAKGDYGEIVDSKMLADGTKVDTRRFKDGRLITFTYSSMNSIYKVINQKNKSQK